MGNETQVEEEPVVEEPVSQLPEPAQLLLAEGKLSEALDVVGPAVAAEPTNVALLTEAAGLNLRAGRYGPARDLAEQALEIEPNGAQNHAIVGAELFQVSVASIPFV